MPTVWLSKGDEDNGEGMLAEDEKKGIWEEVVGGSFFEPVMYDEVVLEAA